MVKPKRIQGAYVSEKEVKRVMDYIKEKRASSNFQKMNLEEGLKTELEKVDTGGKPERERIIL